MAVPERFTGRASDENANYKLVHMGWFAHEFGHLMGAHHTNTSKHHSLMDTGHKAGTTEANRPASMNPWFLYKSGWASLSFINSDMTDVDLTYNTSATTQSTFYIRNVPNSSECFLVENRQYDNTYDQSLPGAVVSLSGGILIWNIDDDGLNLGETDLVEADADATEQQTNMAHDVFRPSVYTSGMISDMTSPANLRQRDGSKSKFAVADFTSTGSTITVDLLVDYDPAPAAPADLEISNAGQNGQSPQLSWDANAEFDLDHYVIYHGYQSGGTGPIYWNPNAVATTSNTSWTDNSYTIDTSGGADVLHYRITAVDDNDTESDYSDSVSTGVEEEVPSFKRSPLPREIALRPNYPNPFNPETQIRFELPEAAEVSLVIYNILGEQVRTLANGRTEAGFHSVRWNGNDDHGQTLPSGVYLYRLQVLAESGGPPVYVQSNKLTLLK